MADNLLQRNGWYYYNKRVPQHLAKYDRRKHVRIALKTQNQKEAQKVAAIYDDFIQKYWGDLIRSGKPDNNLETFKQTRALARAHGFAFKNIAEVLSSPLDEILSRVEASEHAEPEARKALLGRADIPQITLSECPDRFWPLCADRLTDKSEHQIRKYKVPRNSAMQNFIEVVGDKNIADIERSDVLKFRNWFMQRIASDDSSIKINGDTANKQMRHVKDMLHTVCLSAEIDKDIKIMFAETRLKTTMEPRPPFEASYIQEAFIDNNAFVELNHDARMLVHIMMETGARESEIIGLLPEDIILNHEIPHIWIRKNALRSLKTPTSDRQIPLVGVALWAAEQIAETGLTRYQEKPDHASATINKHLRENNLKPTPKHTLYGLRHTFKDRLRDAGAPEEVIDELMGHRNSAPKYGRGHLLETKLKWLRKIVFDMPKNL